MGLDQVQGKSAMKKIAIIAGARLKVKLSHNTNKANLYYHVFKSSNTSY